MGTAVVKRSSRRADEDFSGHKLHRSLHASCLSVNLPDGLADDTASHVVRAVERWCENKAEVTASDIRRIATNSLSAVCPEAGYLYQHHETII